MRETIGFGIGGAPAAPGVIKEDRESRVPSWWDDMDFCHIIEDTNRMTCYCGEQLELGPGGPTCSTYDGLAVCPTCGAPTCPRCAQLCELDNALDGVS